ncbi:dolichyl-diphosphooligosaccharide--protein glycosyltransferase subunit Ost2p [[Candida] anglica]|uniref:Dolichyl-diphosphooligosaccharide--protein glycosyltransferase subunit OST2 n=1 Tax=[Candida] anglica TaxID=148631 RepID=A0ABP0ENK7_9ASCO
MVKKTTTTGTGVQKKIGQPIHDLVGAISTTYDSYFENLTPRLKLIDIFLTFLVLLGVLQFVYVILIGNFPFNAFLGGFISCVGQFVLTVSLRLQYINSLQAQPLKESKVAELNEVVDVDVDVHADLDDVSTSSNVFEQVSPERAFGDYIFASMILHFTVFHFIN